MAAVGFNAELAANVRTVELAGKNRAELLKQLDLVAPAGVSTADLQRMVATGSIGIAGDPEASAAATDDTTRGETAAAGTDPDEVPDSGRGEGSDDFADFVVSSNKPTVLERVGEDAELAEQLKAAEASRGDKARKTLLQISTRSSRLQPRGIAGGSGRLAARH